MLVPGKEYQAEEISQLYQSYPHRWFLLEILETDNNGRAKRLRLLQYANTKDVLYNFLMDEVEDWDWGKNYIFVYSDPEKQCEL